MSIVHGSSPLARGLPSHIPCFGCPKRIIPARAGFTGPRSGALLSGRDHPRSRGVYGVGLGGLHWSSGSSPLARGLQIENSERNLRHRIIPARAGFTERLPITTIAEWGSSPLARGLRESSTCARADSRIIPARAGFTGVGAAFRPRGPDHPRSRGVYTHAHNTVMCNTGSSPLARGLLVNCGPEHMYIRIIPARAGFTAVRRARSERAADHPRSRGVYTPLCAIPSPYDGSSPLARGLLGPTGESLTGGRIIPARAGFTRSRCACWCLGRDHPRSRGVYLL